MLVGTGSLEAQIIPQPPKSWHETLCLSAAVLCSDPARACVHQISALLLQELLMPQMPRPWSLLICCSRREMPQRLYVTQSCERLQVISCRYIYLLLSAPPAPSSYGVFYYLKMYMT